MAAPDKLRIPLEDFEGGRFDCIGRYGDGAGGGQFMAFVTGAYPGPDHYFSRDANWREVKRWNAVVHRFDMDGNHRGSDARLGGFDAEGVDVANDRASHYLETMLRAMGLDDIELCDIYVKPFSVEIDGVVYALEYEHVVEDDYEDEHVMLWPNDVMFHPPWDSGEYST